MSLSSLSWSDDYQKLWLQGDSPGIEQFVKGRGPVPPEQLAGLLILDQALRREKHCGQLPGGIADPAKTVAFPDEWTAEQYFACFPELLDDPESAIDLVFSEFLLLERSGLNPAIDEYVARFPQFADALRRQEAFQRAMDSAGHGGDSSDPGETRSPRTRDSQPASKAPAVPGYQILGELGRGGIGVVYKARHLQLNRPVALKMLLSGVFARESLLQRFVVEAEATARLQHPNIVQIYEVGEHEGRPFLALEYVNGGTLAQWTGARPLPPRDAASIIQTLARAVQFAHGQGVVHRDLKPANVLIQHLASPRELMQDSAGVPDDAPTLLVAAQPDRPRGPFDDFRVIAFDSDTHPKPSFDHSQQLKIADFGLAKLVAGGSSAERADATRSGDVLGTAAYMSPEQARGDATNLTAVTDVYSLGAILYELLTGRPPFVGVQPLEVLGQVIADEPVRPSHLVRRLPRDLQTICLKCLEKAPGRRYGSAGALADDLERFLEGQPIVARHTSTIERTWRWSRRHPVKTSIAASLLTVLLLVAAISSLYSVKLGHQLSLTSQARQKEQASRVQALHQLWESQLAQADAIRTSNQIGQRHDALKAIDVARDLRDSISFSAEQIDRMRNATIACLAQPDLRITSQWKGGVESTATIFTHDKRQGIYAHMQSGNKVVVRRATTGMEVARISVSNPDSIPLLSDDGKRLAILNESCRVYTLETSPPRLVFETLSQGVWGFAPDGSRILGTRGDGLLCLIDLGDAKVIRMFGKVTARDEIAISPDSRRAAVFNGESIQVIDLETAQVSLEIDNPEIRGSKHFAWHPDSRYLAIGPFVAEGIELWDVLDGVRLNTFFHDIGQLGITFNSTGERLLTFDAWGGSLLIWNISSGEVELSKVGLALLAISSDETGGFRLLQKHDNGQLNAVAIEHPLIHYTLPLIHPPGATPSSYDLAYSADGRLLAVVNRGELRVFDARKHTELDRLSCGYCYIHFDCDGSLLTSNETGLARWKLSPVPDSEGEPPAEGATGQFQLGPPVYLTDSVAYAPFDISREGKTIAISTGHNARIHAPDHPDRPDVIGPHQDLRRLSISPDGRRIVTGGWESGQARVWDLASGRLLHTIDEPACCLVQFSPDGKWLVTNTGRVRIWNAESWALVAELPVAGNSVSGVQVCFSPDGRLLAVSDSSGRINLFDPANGRKVVVLTDPNEHRADLMAFNPVGDQLAVLTQTRSAVVHVWDLAAIHDELIKRDLDLAPGVSLSVSLENGTRPNAAAADRESRVSRLSFVPDQRFVEIEAARQYDLLKQASEKHDLSTARAAITNLIKLQPRRASTCNNLAWTLVAGPPLLRDSATAVEFARRANADESLSAADRALYINTLGVALYRDDLIQEATEILEQSLAIQPADSQPFDLYFLSMCGSRAGDPTRAREYFDRANSLVEQHRSGMSNDWRTELASFADEAALLLK